MTDFKLGSMNFSIDASVHTAFQTAAGKWIGFGNFLETLYQQNG